MRKLRFFASAACLLSAVTSTSSAPPKVKEAVVGPEIASSAGHAPAANQKK